MQERVWKTLCSVTFFAVIPVHSANKIIHGMVMVTNTTVCANAVCRLGVQG